MRLSCHIERMKKTIDLELPDKSTVGDLLDTLKINPLTVLVVRKGQVLIEKTPLQDKDEVKVLSVVSGG